MMPEPKVEPEVSQPKTYDESYIKELRGEAASYRIERNDLRKTVEELGNKIKGFEDGNKSEVEKITERAATAERALADKEREIAEAQIRSKVISEASKLNIVDLDAAYKLLDMSQIDENPASVKKALTSLIKDKPFLVKSNQPPSPGVGGPPVQGKKTSDQMWVDMMKKGVRK